MKDRTSIGRYVVYACLGFGTILFAFPLLWMVITSLMPIEQAMTYPPNFIPRAHFVVIDGERVEVTADFEIGEPGVLVEINRGNRAGERFFLPHGYYNPEDPGLALVKEVEAGWWQVTQRSESGTAAIERNLARDIVPPDAIETVIQPRWSNYPDALGAMGGRVPQDLGEKVDETIPEGVDGHVSFFTFLWNTVIVCVLGVIGTVISNSIIAYGFARVKWRGRDTFFALTLATMMVPFPVLMVPLYAVFKELGWIGTLLPLWVPAFFGSAFNIFLMRQFFRTIPEELSEAARIDGCSEWRIFWRIIIPLSRPVLAVSALFHFLWAWNDFLGPLLFLTRKHTFTLALALQSYQTQHGGVQWHFLMAASAVTVIPIVILFFFAQKTFIQGIATTGSKS